MTDLFGRSDCTAVISPCETYRYELRRAWDTSLPLLGWAMLNPSTADAESDDATIRRCVLFSKAWGHGGIVVVNLFALRATDPHELLDHPNPVGPDNDTHINRVAGECRTVVCAWGAHRMAEQRADHVLSGLKAAGVDLRCLGTTKGGYPRHPVRLSASTPLVPYEHVNAKEAA